LSEKIVGFQLISLAWLPFYSFTEDHWNHIDSEAHFLIVKYDLLNCCLVSFEKLLISKVNNIVDIIGNTSFYLSRWIFI